jgi:hypothetical protein
MDEDLKEVVEGRYTRVGVGGAKAVGGVCCGVKGRSGSCLVGDGGASGMETVIGFGRVRRLTKVGVGRVGGRGGRSLVSADTAERGVDACVGVEAPSASTTCTRASHLSLTLPTLIPWSALDALTLPGLGWSRSAGASCPNLDRILSSHLFIATSTLLPVRWEGTHDEEEPLDVEPVATGSIVVLPVTSA